MSPAGRPERIYALFVVDAGPETGLGHASRCAALAHELAARGLTVAVQCADPELARPVFGQPVHPYEDRSAPLIVMDGYRFSDAEKEARRYRCDTLVLIDDLADAPFAADIVVNQNLHAKGLDYSAYRAAQVLAGPEYALLRPAFADLHATPRPHDGAILVTLGASTLGRKAIGIANRIAERIDRQVHVVVGEGLAATEPLHPRVEVLSGVDMPDLMKTCRHYIGAMGVSYLEALAAGLSTTAIAIPASQQPAVEAARRQGLTVLDRIDDPGLVSTVEDALSQPLMPSAMPDGLGVRRVTAAIAARS